MKKFLKFIPIIMFGLYPFAVYYGLSHFDARYVAITLAIIFSLRFVVVKSSKDAKSILLWLTALGVAFALVAFCMDSIFPVKLYPVMMSLAFFAVFTISLYKPPSIVTRIASKTRKEPLPPEAIEYTKKVTIAWCVYFIVNALIATMTIFASTQIWTLYNGFVSYCLMGVMIVGELIIRKFVIAKQVNLT